MIILTVAYAVQLVISIFLMALHMQDSRDIADMKNTIKYLLDTQNQLSAKNRVIEKKLIKASEPEKLIIEHDWKKENVDFGGF